jgi:hypothetical protein
MVNAPTTDSCRCEGDIRCGIERSQTRPKSPVREPVYEARDWGGGERTREVQVVQRERVSDPPPVVGTVALRPMGWTMQRMSASGVVLGERA